MAELDINDPNRIAAENADIARIAAEKKAAKQEIGGVTPLPAIPQPQMPTTQLRNGVREQIGAPQSAPNGSDSFDNGRIVDYGGYSAVYGKNGKIQSWMKNGADGNVTAETPESMKMLARFRQNGDTNTYGLTPEQLETADGQIAYARLGREEKSRRLAQYNIRFGNALGTALDDAYANFDAKNVKEEKFTRDDGTEGTRKYVIGTVPTDNIGILNQNLKGLGRHSVKTVAAKIYLNALGEPIKENPVFYATFNEGGMDVAGGKTSRRVIDAQQVRDTMRDAYKEVNDFGGYDSFEKNVLGRDYQMDRQKRKQAEEDRALQTRLTEAKIGDVAAKVSGVSAVQGSNGRAAIAAAIKANPTAFAQALLTNQAFLDFASRGKPMTEKGKDGKYVPMIDPKTGEQMYERKSPDETMEFVANILNGFDGGKFVTDRMQKLNMLNAMSEAEKNALNVQPAQPQEQTQPAQTAQPQSTETAQPAPTAQPASPNLTDLSAPTQGGANPTNIVANLAKQTFGDPSAQAPTARQATPTAKSNSLTYEKIDNLERKPNETDEDYAERQADLRAGLRKKDFVKAGGVYETNEDGTEKFRLKDWEFLNGNEGRYTLRESDEFTDEMMDAQKLIQKKKSEYESKLKDERNKIRAEALKKHPASKVKRDKYISERMSEWEKENDPRLSKPVTAATVMP